MKFLRTNTEQVAKVTFTPDGQSLLILSESFQPPLPPPPLPDPSDPDAVLEEYELRGYMPGWEPACDVAEMLARLATWNAEMSHDGATLVGIAARLRQARAAWLVGRAVQIRA